MIPISRNTDPSTSHQAADEIRTDGTLGRMEETALKLIRTYPGCTANELEAEHGYRDGQIRKRLGALEESGLICRGAERPSRITRKMNVTWYPVHQPQDGQGRLF